MYYRTKEISDSETDKDIYRAIRITPGTRKEFGCVTFADVFKICSSLYNNFEDINRDDLNDTKRKVYDVLTKYIDKQNGFAIENSTLVVTSHVDNYKNVISQWDVTLVWQVYTNNFDKCLIEDDNSNRVVIDNEFFDNEFISSSMEFAWPSDDIESIKKNIDNIEKEIYIPKSNNLKKYNRLVSINHIFNLNPDNFEVFYENKNKQNKYLIVVKNRIDKD